LPTLTNIDFGVLSMKTSGGLSATAAYGCALDGQSDTAKKQCVAFLIGGILTMLYEIAAAIFMLVAIIYAAMGLKNNAFSPRLWLFSGLALAASLAALLTWPLSSHLVLLNLMESAHEAHAHAQRTAPRLAAAPHPRGAPTLTPSLLHLSV